jgi:hypothetical protein
MLFFSSLITPPKSKVGIKMIDQRRSERIVDFLPLEIHAIDLTSGQVLAGPFSARIIDISAHGACLLVTQVLLNGFHVFYTSRESDDTALRLTIDETSDVGQQVLIARPIWMDVFRQDEIRAFKMGVEFTLDLGIEQMRDVQAALSTNQGKRASWWQKHCKVWTKES